MKLKEKQKISGSRQYIFPPYITDVDAFSGLVSAVLLSAQALFPIVAQASPSSSSSAAVQKSSTASERTGARKSPASKRKHGLNEAQALQIVADRPEVKAWQKQITTDKTAKARGCSAHIALDRKEAGSYVVHVYEEVPDGDDGSGHTATFNWYHVNEKTSKVTTEF